MSGKLNVSFPDLTSNDCSVCKAAVPAGSSPKARPTMWWRWQINRTIEQQLGELEALLGQGMHGTAAGLKTLEQIGGIDQAGRFSGERSRKPLES